MRPDFVIGDKTAFEIKNYDIAKNSDGLVREIVRQVKSRAIHLPQGMKQFIKIDIRGQKITPEIERGLKQSIVSKTNGIIEFDSIDLIRK